MRLLARAAATAVAVAAATTTLAAPAAATEAPSPSGCVFTYLDNRPSYGFVLDPLAFVNSTIQVHGIPGPVTLDPTPTVRLATGVAIIALNEANAVVGLVYCIV